MEKMRRHGGLIVAWGLVVWLSGCAGVPEGAGEATVGRAEQPLRFIIIPDRTGGERPGVFAKALEHINVLHPALVMSVGDLIEGYTEDPKVAEAQWDELVRLLDQVEAPFYYVPGNHDISNVAMAEWWERRFGPRYYYFLHDDVLFICLNTEEGLQPGGMEIQAARVCRTLEQHRDARYTFVFLHKPVWTWDPVPAWWRRIEYALADRPYAVFAGHDHMYRKYVRFGRPYYALGTCGGWSYLEGVYAGLFDHITQVTLVGTNLTVVNLRVDGILADDVVTAETLEAGRRLSAEGVRITPVMFTGERFERGEMKISVSNCLGMPMRFAMHVAGEGPVVAEAQPMECVLQPNEVAAWGVGVEGTTRATNDVAGVVDVTWAGECMPSGKKAFGVQGRRRVGVIREKEVRRVGRPVVVDGRLDEWEGLKLVCTKMEHATGAREEWYGPEDCSFVWDVTYDDRGIWVGVKVSDEVVMGACGEREDAHDEVVFMLRALDASKVGTSAWLSIALRPGQGTNAWELCEGTPLPQGVEFAGVSESGGYGVEIGIPYSALGVGSVSEWESMDVNVGVTDADSADAKNVTLWWQPTDWSRDWYVGAGWLRKGSER